MAALVFYHEGRPTPFGGQSGGPFTHAVGDVGARHDEIPGGLPAAQYDVQMRRVRISGDAP